VYSLLALPALFLALFLALPVATLLAIAAALHAVHVTHRALTALPVWYVSQ
jgi:hypothetical protein